MSHASHKEPCLSGMTSHISSLCAETQALDSELKSTQGFKSSSDAEQSSCYSSGHSEATSDGLESDLKPQTPSYGKALSRSIDCVAFDLSSPSRVSTDIDIGSQIDVTSLKEPCLSGMTSHINSVCLETQALDSELKSTQDLNSSSDAGESSCCSSG